jgi:hypothetical protein
MIKIHKLLKINYKCFFKPKLKRKIKQTNYFKKHLNKKNVLIIYFKKIIIIKIKI